MKTPTLVLFQGTKDLRVFSSCIAKVHFFNHLKIFGRMERDERREKEMRESKEQ
jgi:hypothetical protein